MPAQFPVVITLVQLIVAPLQLSVAVANPFALAEESAVNKIVTFAGQVIAGALLSLTEMLCEQDDELLHPSVAVNERVMR